MLLLQGNPINRLEMKEFYICFIVGARSLGSTLSFCDDKSELTSFQKQAVITLFEKRGKDKRFIKNWRLISLLDVDFKITSNTLVERLKTVINKLTAYDQTAHVKGCYIGESIRVIQGLIDFPDLEEQEGLIFSSDMEKALNSVYHNFLFSVLMKFGIGLYFNQWVKSLSYGSESCIMFKRLFSVA